MARRNRSCSESRSVAGGRRAEPGPEGLAVCVQGLLGAQDGHSVSRTWAMGSARL